MKGLNKAVGDFGLSVTLCSVSAMAYRVFGDYGEDEDKRDRTLRKVTQWGMLLGSGAYLLASACELSKEIAKVTRGR